MLKKSKMEEEKTEKLLKNIKKLQKFELKYKLHDPNTPLSYLSNKQFDKWMKLTKLVFLTKV